MFPGHWSFERIVVHGLAEIITNQQLIRHNQGEIMSVLTDVQAKLAKLKADLQAFVAANTGGASDADLVAIGVLIDDIETIIAPPALPVTPAV